jgi:hypothetical protein
MWYIIIIALLFIWVYIFWFLEIRCGVFDDFRNGDLVFFKNLDNWYGCLMGSYVTHVGIVFWGDGEWMILEANPLGVGVYKAWERVNRAFGYCYVKHLKKEMSEVEVRDLIWFSGYCCDNMWYERKLGIEYLKKIVGKGCGKNTNCAELVWLCLKFIGYDVGLPWHSHYIWWCRDCDLYESDYLKIIRRGLVTADGIEIVNNGL